MTTSSPRIFVASIATETNTFSPLRTDMQDFRDSFYAPPGTHPITPTLCSAVFPVCHRRAKAEGWKLIEGLATWAEPGGVVNQLTWTTLRDTLLGQLRAALPVDAVLLGLHGAMVAQNCEDCEGELLRHVRAMVGDTAIVGATLDPHSHLTPARVEHADLLVAFKEFPHTDFVESAEVLVDLSLRALRGEIRLRMSVFDCRMIDIFPTTREPMRGFIDRLKQLEGRGSILSISLIHGFMAGDVPQMGTKVLVVSNDDQPCGDALAHELGLELFALRGQTCPAFLNAKSAITKAMALTAKNTAAAPVVVADVWDNPGGGVPGDSTWLLRELLEQGAQNAALATIWDPIAVRTCISAGEGAVLPLRFGAKMASGSGEPLDAQVCVKRIVKHATQRFGSSIVPLGDAVTIDVNGIEVVLNTIRSQVFSPDVFLNMGIYPQKKCLLVVKSTNHFYAAFAKISTTILYAAVDGVYPNNPSTNAYTRVRKPLWPLDENPFTFGLKTPHLRGT